ncbi:MAG: endonuclease III [Thermoplasmata archaeon]
MPAKKRRGKPEALTPSFVLESLEKMHPDARIELRFSNPLELLVATILSAQSTDKKVNEVTERLFKKYRTAADYASADPETFEQEIRSTGFYRAKTRLVLGAAKMIVDEFGGEVPRTMEELTRLPGVARKTANIVLSGAFGVSEGIAVDTHVRRVAARLGLTKEKDPMKIERDLMAFFPREKWGRATNLLVFLGRYTCKARAPDCGRCLLSPRCPSSTARGG